MMPRRNRGAVLSEASILFVVTGAVVCISICMASIRYCEAFPKHNRVHRSNNNIYMSSSSPSSLLIRLYDSPGLVDDDERERVNTIMFDVEEELPITPPLSSSNEFDRRNFLFVATAAMAFFPVQSAKAYQDEEMATKKTLEDLQFARGSWNPGSQAKENSMDNIDDQNLLASVRNDNNDVAPTARNNAAMTRIDACFITYLTRFLINYDEGVAAWWQHLQVSYSLLSNEQRQSRLGRDFGSLAASVQDALQIYIQKANSNRQGYEQLFERFASTYTASTTNDDEVKRHLCLLAATLPVDLQPRDAIQKIINTKTMAKSSKKQLDSSSLAVAMSEDLSSLLPREYTTVVSNSDGVLSIQPSISLYQVGVGEEFGQAVTATTFGPLALNALRRELPRYTFDIYALFGISGATGCAITHSFVIPLDVVKTRSQTSPESTMNIVTEIVEKEGFTGLLTGAQATLAGYAWYGISVYPSYAFFKRFFGHTLLAPDLAVAHANDIALIAGALAAVIASLGLTPLEAARIRVVAEPTKYRSMGLIGTLQTIASEGGGTGLSSSMESLYKGLPSLMTRQVIFGSIKFVAFERACEALYLAWPMLRDETWTALSVSLVAGAFSGALSCFVSQPADAVLTYVAQESSNDSKGLGVLEGSRLMIEESGVSSLFRGLGSRSLWAASIISGQFLLYDIFRNYFGVNSDDLSQIFQIDL
jgi:solute carrier family 25 phosphate transporter 3